jgi:hypothetical protein
MRVLWPGFPCLDSLRGPLGFEAACAGSLSNCTTIFLSYKRHEYVLHALPFETHKPKLQTRYTDIHTEATCSSVAFTKFALLSPQVFPFVPDRNNIYGECLCMRASASTFEFDIVHISLPGLASSLQSHGTCHKQKGVLSWDGLASSRHKVHRCHLYET